MKTNNILWSIAALMFGAMMFVGCQPEDDGGKEPTPTDDYYGSIEGYWDFYVDEQDEGTYRFYNILNSDGTYQCLYAYILKNGTLKDAGWLDDGKGYWKASKGKLTYGDETTTNTLYYRMYKDEYVLVYNSLSDDLEDYYTWWIRVSKSDISDYIKKANGGGDPDPDPDPDPDKGEPTGGKPQPNVG